MDFHDDDVDLAFELQLQEAMTDSLIQSQMESKETIYDPETLELLLRFEQEQSDAEKWEVEMRRIRDELKIRTHDQMFAQEILRIPEDYWQKYGDNVQKPFGEGTSSSSRAAPVDGGEPFRLYFKGLYSNVMVGNRLEIGSIAAIGAAVCDPRGNLILNVQKPLIGDWKSDWAPEDLLFKVDVKALIEGLNAALSLDIKKIDFFCDFYPLYQYITMRWLVKQEKIGTVVDQVCLLQRKFSSCRPFFVARNDVAFAFKLARDAIDSQIVRSAESSRARNLKQTCSICLEDTDVGQMFTIDGCLHHYCVSCMKQHVEVKLLHGMVPKCPHEGCTTQLNIPICRKFLPPDLIDLMHQRIKESSIPATEKVYCPYPKCSVLMSKSEVLPYTTAIVIGFDRSVAKKCIQCHGLFCINCKVPWHDNMNCHEYKRQNPNLSAEDAKLKSLATTRSWRQCMKCKHMIELAEGCYHITCRCGYEFCYTCGAEWRNKKATCRCPVWDERNIVNDRRQRR
ncbi:Atp-dependent rna helicase deah12 protein [Thalictrum thalictroides]|uniref:RBR-type E3 ubiquitin transferase n=1 Tax=Thalictrum thalictroides TaxID=46969 RepID=A0A7J6WRM9_THATH|nr:Atp-dependent rna helicase deah12 protein [Thalictrum thalictroides]